jgi:hypothetical protein
LKTFYAIAAIVGAALPYSQFVAWLGEHGPDAAAFVQAIVSNRVSTFAWFDVLVSAVVLLAFTVWEGRRLGISGLWLPVVATVTVGVSCGLPLFLLLRQIRIEADQRRRTTNPS